MLPFVEDINSSWDKYFDTSGTGLVLQTKVGYIYVRASWDSLMSFLRQRSVFAQRLKHGGIYVNILSVALDTPLPV